MPLDDDLVGNHFPPRRWLKGGLNLTDCFWISVQGERFCCALRSIDLPEEATTRRMVGHSHVLALDSSQTPRSRKNRGVTGDAVKFA